MFIVSLIQRRHVIPTALPTVGVHGAELTDADGEEVHVYAHPSKAVNNLQQQREKEKVLSTMFLFDLNPC